MFGLPVLQAVDAACVGAVVFCTHIFFSHVTSPRTALRVLPLFLAAGFALWHTVFSMQGIDASWNDFFIGYGMMGCFTVVYTEIFLNLYRGFSYTIIADIAARTSMTEDELCTVFADGMGEHGMMERRFSSMERAHLIERKDGLTTLLPRGRFFGGLSSALRSFLRLDAGGGEPPVS